MNWIGGARNRVKFRGERKVQQEFFEKQKMSAVSDHISKKKRRLSQDLVALHTVSKVHSRSQTASAVRRSIKNLDLEKFRSCTHRIDEIDMGPCSPSTTPSKLHLNDGQNDKITVSSSSRSLLKTTPDISEHQVSKQKTFQVPLSQTDRNINAQDVNTNKYETNFTDLPKGHHKFSFSNSKQSYKHDGYEAKRKFDMFVSEDFQVTPLTRYEKEALKQEHKGRKNHQHKIMHNMNEISNENGKNPYQCDAFITDEKKFKTSTPLKDGKGKKSNSKRSGHFTPVEHSFKSLDSISPIIRERKCSGNVDDFQFKPRYMYASLEHSQSDKDSTKSMDLNSKPSLSESVFHEVVSPVDSSFSVTSFMADGKIYKVNEEMIQNKQDDLKTPIKHIQKTNDITSQYSSEMSPQEYIFKNRNSHYQFKDFQPNCVTSNMKSPLLSKTGHDNGFYGDSEVVDVNAKSKLMVKEMHDQSQGKQHFQVYSKLDKSDHKPYNTDIMDDFIYPSMSIKGKQSLSQANQSIMDLYKNADEGNRDCGSSSSFMFEHVGIDLNPLSENFVRKVHSPLPADEFPQHLKSPVNQNREKITDTLTGTAWKGNIEERYPEFIPAVENSARNYSHSHSSQQSSLNDVKVNSHLEDLLDEMKHLEDQSVGSQTASYCPVLDDTEPIPSKTESTDSQEADIVAEMEDRLLQSDIEHFHLHRESVEKMDGILKQHTGHEILTNQEILHSDEHESKPGDKIPSKSQMDNKCSINCHFATDRICFGGEIIAETNLEGSSSHDNDKAENITESKPSDKIPSKGQTDNDCSINCHFATDRICFGGEIIAETNLEGSSSHDNDQEENNTDREDVNCIKTSTQKVLKAGNQASTDKNESHCNKTYCSESQTDKFKVGMTSIMQQTDLPSCAEIGTQTVDFSPKLFTSIGTSPHTMEKLEQLENCCVGTQCDLKVVPTLTSICLKRRLWNMKNP